MKYLNQILFEMRKQPLMTWLSIIGTSIAIFLIMCDFMINNIASVNVTPETRRDRILYGTGMYVRAGESSSFSSYLSLHPAQQIYGDLDGIECVSYSTESADPVDISVKGAAPSTLRRRGVDGNFWKIYDFEFLQGSPFSTEEAQAGVKNVVLSESTAISLFGKGEDVLGRELTIDHRPYRVSGVVSDVSPILKETAADLYVSTTAIGADTAVWHDHLGELKAILLMKPGIDQEHITRQVRSRYASLNSRLAKDDMEVIYLGQPYNSVEKSSDFGTNTAPDLESPRRMRIISYVILMLIPAINLSSMTRSRLRRRVSEIGLRRAFGCTRLRIISDLIIENLILSLFGAAIGLVLSVAFVLLFSNYFFNFNGFFLESFSQTQVRPTFDMLFNWTNFAAVCIACFILNLLSAGIPAMKAASVNPAEALSGDNIHK